MMRSRAIGITLVVLSVALGWLSVSGFADCGAVAPDPCIRSNPDTRTDSTTIAELEAAQSLSTAITVTIENLPVQTNVNQMQVMVTVADNGGQATAALAALLDVEDAGGGFVNSGGNICISSGTQCSASMNIRFRIDSAFLQQIGDGADSFTYPFNVTFTLIDGSGTTVDTEVVSYTLNTTATVALNITASPGSTTIGRTDLSSTTKSVGNFSIQHFAISNYQISGCVQFADLVGSGAAQLGASTLELQITSSATVLAPFTSFSDLTNNCAGKAALINGTNTFGSTVSSTLNMRLDLNNVGNQDALNQVRFTIELTITES